MDYPLLEDISYIIWDNDEYDLEQVIPNTCMGE
jgi:hypothetical protein